MIKNSVITESEKKPLLDKKETKHINLLLYAGSQTPCI